ncbi:MAG: hypothetical protein DMF93_22205 [Acidobacteria bacterium]|nr:MAG: hypothetical protein DMF93_22205 [Acidobacteriota bacterium]
MATSQAYAEQRWVKAHRSHQRSQYAEMKSMRSVFIGRVLGPTVRQMRPHRARCGVALRAK